MARLTTLIALCALLALPATTGAATKPKFKLGTYTGTVGCSQQQGEPGTCGTFSLKLRKGRCAAARQTTKRLSGYCFTLRKFPDLVAPCPGGTVQTSQLYPYDVIIGKSGVFTDSVQTYTSADQPVATYTLKFVARGSKIQGSVSFEGTSDSNTTGKRDCSSGELLLAGKLKK
jgi:hypothetical protein